MNIGNLHPSTTLSWFEYPAPGIPIFRSVQRAILSPTLLFWHVQYEPLRFSPQCTQTQQALRAAGLDSATMKRQAEFWAGRRLMMLAFSLPNPPGRMASGAPCLPSDCSGSLSHSSDNILLLAGPKGLYIGADIERLLAPATLQAVMNRVATRTEKRWLHRLTPLQQQFAATLLFSAKETLFKALCAEVNLNPGYASAEAPAPPQHGILSIELTQDLGLGLNKRRRFDLHYDRLEGFALTWLYQSPI